MKRKAIHISEAVLQFYYYCSGGVTNVCAVSTSYNTVLPLHRLSAIPGFATLAISENHYDVASQVLMLFADGQRQ